MSGKNIIFLLLNINNIGTIHIILCNIQIQFFMPLIHHSSFFSRFSSLLYHRFLLKEDVNHFQKKNIINHRQSVL